MENIFSKLGKNSDNKLKVADLWQVIVGSGFSILQTIPGTANYKQMRILYNLVYLEWLKVVNSKFTSHTSCRDVD